MADGMVVMASIRDVRLCADCITAKTSLPTARVAMILKRAQMTVRLAVEGTACGECSRTLTVYGLGWRQPKRT